MSPSRPNLICALLIGTCLTASAEPLDEPLKPLPPAPRQDPQRIELGRQLFDETRLSLNNSLSYASGHHL